MPLGGRTLDFWIDWGDGKAARPAMLALIDDTSNMVLDWELTPSNSAVGTVRLFKRTCERYGIFDRLYTDNGSAFAGHLVAGGNVHRFRHGKAKDGVQPLGICSIMGFDLPYALPRAAQAKISERVLATLSGLLDDRPELKDVHAGHAPGASSFAQVRPVPVDTACALLRREFERRNREGGRHSWRCYAEVERRIESAISQDEPLATKARLLRSISGIGPVSAAILIAAMPELGRMRAGEAAAMTGLTPVSHASGTMCGRRMIAGGRRSLTCAVPGSARRRMPQSGAEAFRKAPEGTWKTPQACHNRCRTQVGRNSKRNPQKSYVVAFRSHHLNTVARSRSLRN